MSCSFIKFEVGGHRGLVRLTVDFEAKSENQLVTYVHKSQQKISDTCYLWRFNGTTINMRPQTAFEYELLTKKERQAGFDKEMWQPQFLYAMFTSRAGCQFGIKLEFVDEEELAQKRQAIGCGLQEAKVRSKLRQLVEEKLHAVQFEENAIGKINKEIYLLKLRKRQREKMFTNIDYVA